MNGAHRSVDVSNCDEGLRSFRQRARSSWQCDRRSSWTRGSGRRPRTREAPVDEANRPTRRRVVRGVTFVVDPLEVAQLSGACDVVGAVGEEEDVDEAGIDDWRHVWPFDSPAVVSSLRTTRHGRGWRRSAGHYGSASPSRVACHERAYRPASGPACESSGLPRANLPASVRTRWRVEWRKRLGVEPSPPAERGATGFEDREGHRAPFASGPILSPAGIAGAHAGRRWRAALPDVRNARERRRRRRWATSRAESEWTRPPGIAGAGAPTR